MTECESDGCTSTATYLVSFKHTDGQYRACPDCTDGLRASRPVEVRRLGGI